MTVKHRCHLAAIGGPAPGRGSSLLRIAALGLVLGLGACATPPPADDEAAVEAYDEANDPFEPMNRTIFEINQGLDAALFRPLAIAYRKVFPDDVRDGMRNVTRNLNTPQNFIHDVLQGEPERAADSAARFAVNSLAGAGGALDVMAMETGTEGEVIPYHDEDLGQTLAVWGFEEGPYLMLPLFGPSNVRDTVGRVGDIFLDPFRYVIPDDIELAFGLSRRLASGIDARSRNIESLDEIERTSIDFYVTIRSLYRQFRAAEILNGEPAEPEDAPDIEFEEEDAPGTRVSKAKTN